MTSRIYYTDPSAMTFDAVVVRAVVHDGKPAVVLDRTAFYPTSGGQPFDTGRLGVAGVVDVVDDASDVIHVLTEPLEEGLRVTGEINRERRLDHMQQHTGQHILSAAFDRRFGNATVGFHMGADVSSIDLAGPAGADEIAAAVLEANHIVWENRTVSIRFVSEGETAGLPLRKEPARGGPLRLIEVDGFDLSACGGTHVSRTGAIGMIAVVAHEKLRGGVRVSFVCGGRALRTFGTYRDAVSGTVRTLSVLPHELPQAVERVQNESRDLRKTIQQLQERLTVFEAERLIATAESIGGVRGVLAVIDGWDVAAMKMLASSVARHSGILTILLSASAPAAVVIARATDVSVDAGQLLRALTQKFGGRGGGKPELAQGGGLTGSPAEFLKVARELIAPEG